VDTSLASIIAAKNNSPLLRTTFRSPEDILCSYFIENRLSNIRKSPHKIVIPEFSILKSQIAIEYQAKVNSYI